MAKESVKSVVKPAEEKAPAQETVKETVKAAGAKTKDTAKKTPGRKPAVKKEEVKPQVTVQLWDKEFDIATVEQNVKAQYVSEGHRAGSIKKICIYVKPEEGYAYYVINEKHEGRVYLY